MVEIIVPILILWFLLGLGLAAEGFDNLFENNKVTVGDIFYVIGVLEFLVIVSCFAGVIWLIAWPFIKLSKVVLWRGKNG